MKIDEYWWVPVLVRKSPTAKPQMLERYLRPTRKYMIEDFVAASYSGKYDWQYRRKLGWQAVKVRIISGKLRR